MKTRVVRIGMGMVIHRFGRQQDERRGSWRLSRNCSHRSHSSPGPTVYMVPMQLKRRIYVNLGVVTVLGLSSASPL